VFGRYAIYVTLDGPLAGFGAAWLGWDISTGRPVALPQDTDLDLEAITRTPRKYGLHATIKPPFRLAEGQSRATLEADFAAFCAAEPAVTVDGLRLSRIGPFLALTAVGDPGGLERLAARAVEHLDPFRAPPGEEDLRRRRAAGLTPAQDALLLRWGYPYVMEEFQFHITLSGALDAATVRRVEAVLEPRLAPLLPAPFRVGHLTLAGEDEEGMFHAIHRVALSG
jgi:hypothetical protein